MSRKLLYLIVFILVGCSLEEFRQEDLFTGRGFE